MSAESQWYYARNGQQLGPVSAQTVRALLRNGQLSATDVVWCEGMSQWQPAQDIAALMQPAANLPPVIQAYASPPPVPAASLYAAQPDARQYGAAPIPYYPSGASYNGLAIAGFVLAFIMPLVGLILSLVALNGMKTSGNYEGHGLAKAGVIIPIAIFGALLLFACLWFTLFAAVLGMSGRG